MRWATGRIRVSRAPRVLDPWVNPPAGQHAAVGYGKLRNASTAAKPSSFCPKSPSPVKVLNLQCAHGHAFEGWFASQDAFDAQSAGGLVECPLCGDRAITKLLSAPRLNLGSARPPEAPAAKDQTPAKPEVAEASSPEGRWLRAVREVMARTEDVGERFSEEARRMHYGETEERGIRGQATPEQARSLAEEGIPVFSMALPASLKQTLQ
jgi:hypothetical protein